MKLTGTYTQAGEKLAAGLLAGEKLTVSRIAAGSGSTPLSAAALEPERQELGLCQPQAEGNSAVLRCTLSSQQASQPYQLTELGVYALDSTGKAVLYLIYRLDEPVSVDPAARLVLRFNLEQTLSDGAGVEVTAPLNGLVTQEQLDGKADLVSGQLPYAQAPHLTANVALYVSPTGNDDNPGTQQAPFKTIQAAVDSLPRDLGNFAVTILLAEGTYDEDVTISGFVGGAPYYAFSIRTESAEHTESCQVKSIRIINCVPMVQMKWFSITGTGQQAAAIEVEGSTAWLDGMILQYQGDVGTTSGVLAGSYGQATVRMVSSSIEGYRWGFRNCHLGKSSLNTCKISNCTTGAYAVESIMFLVNMTYTGNQTDKQRENYAQIYDSTNPN